MGCCCCKESDSTTIRNAKTEHPLCSSPHEQSTTFESKFQFVNPKLHDEAEKTRKQLDKSIHVFVVSCASELGEEVLRIVYAELFRAVEQISNEFFSPIPIISAITNPSHQNHVQKQNNSHQLLLIENVRSYLSEIFAAADKDSFVVVEQDRSRGRRTQIDAFGRIVKGDATLTGSSRTNNNSSWDKSLSLSSTTNSLPLLLEQSTRSERGQNNHLADTAAGDDQKKKARTLRGGGGTFGDEVGVTTSIPSFRALGGAKKKGISRSNNNNNNNNGNNNNKHNFRSGNDNNDDHDGDDDDDDDDRKKQHQEALLAEFEKEVVGDVDDADVEGKQSSRSRQWTKRGEGGDADDGNDEVIGSASGEGDDAHQRQSKSKSSPSSSTSSATTRILRIWLDAVSITSQTSFRPVFDRVQLIKMWLLGDRVYSGNLSVETVVKLLEAAAHEQRLNSELADRIITQLVRMQRRTVNPLTSMNFADLFVVYQEYGFWFPELERFWENASELSKKRSQLAAERIASERLKQQKEMETLLVTTKGKHRFVLPASIKSNGRASDNKELIRSMTEEEVRNSPEFVEALASLPEDVLTKNDLIQFLLFHQRTVSSFFVDDSSSNTRSKSRSSPSPTTSSSTVPITAAPTRQRQASFSTAKARKQAEVILESVGGYCSKEAFLRYLIDPELNGALSATCRDGAITHDMTLPINNYFISSSFKTFLSSDKIRNRADVGMFRRVLQEGCRCIELEIWENSNNNNHNHNNQPRHESAQTYGSSTSSSFCPLVVYFNPNPNSTTTSASSMLVNTNNNNNNNSNNNNGKQGTSSSSASVITKLPLLQVLSVINENAFSSSSSYPLIIHLDIHVYDKTNQEALANALQRSFGSSLVKPNWNAGEIPSSTSTSSRGVGGGEENSFSPDALVNKILLMGKRSLGIMTRRDAERVESMDARALVNRMHAPAFARQTFDLRRNQQQAKSGDSAILIPELGDLIFFDTVGGVVDISMPVPPNVYPYHCTQLEEQKGLGFCSRYSKQCITAASRQLINVFPEGARTNCSNFNPQLFWNAGVQLCSMSWQDGGLEARMYKKRFALDNGNCGYLRKPAYMISDEVLMQHHYDSSQNCATSNNTPYSSSSSLSSPSSALSFKLSVEFLSAIQLPTITPIYNPTTGRTVYRSVRDPYLIAYVEGPLLDSVSSSSSSSSSRQQQQSQRSHVVLFPPSMSFNEKGGGVGGSSRGEQKDNDDDDDDIFASFLYQQKSNFSPQLDSTLRLLSSRQSAKGESGLSRNSEQGSAEGTHHPIFVDLVLEAFAAEFKRNRSAKKVYSTSSAANSTNFLQKFLDRKKKDMEKHVLELNIPVPELSTLVIQLVVDVSSANPIYENGSNSSPSSCASPAASVPTSTTSFAGQFNNSTASFKWDEEMKSRDMGAGGGGGGGGGTATNTSSTASASASSFTAGCGQSPQNNYSGLAHRGNSKYVIAEAFLPIHLLQTGVRCVSLHDVNTYPNLSDLPETRLMVKISKQNHACLSKKELLLAEDHHHHHTNININNSSNNRMMSHLDDDSTTNYKRDADENKQGALLLMDEEELEGTFGELSQMILGGAANNFVDREDEDFWNSNVNPLLNELKKEREKGEKERETNSTSGNTQQQQTQERQLSGVVLAVSEVDEEKQSKLIVSTTEEEEEGCPLQSEQQKQQQKFNSSSSSAPIPRRRRGDTTVDEFFDNISAAMTKPEDDDAQVSSNHLVAATAAATNDNHDEQRHVEFEPEFEDFLVSRLKPAALRAASASASAPSPSSPPKKTATIKQQQQQNGKEVLYEQALKDFLGGDEGQIAL